MQIRVAAQTAALVKQLRGAWEQLMLQKVRSPAAPFTETQTRIREMIVGLLEEAQ